MSKIEMTKITRPTLDDDADFDNKFVKSLENEAVKKFGASANAYLLSFHDDGVVWGKFAGGKLLTSDTLKDSSGNNLETPSPAFRTETLQECRLFNEIGELLVWRGDGQYKARWIIDDATEKVDEYFVEKQVLWGTKTENGNEDFTVVADGSEGLRHAFPQELNFKGKKRPLRLHVRHYVKYDGDGCAKIAFSRLAGISVE